MFTASVDVKMIIELTLYTTNRIFIVSGLLSWIFNSVLICLLNGFFDEAKISEMKVVVMVGNKICSKSLEDVYLSCTW